MTARRKTRPATPAPIDLDAIQDRRDPHRKPQGSYEAWCRDQDQQWTTQLGSLG